jgi:hypothetical protein
MLPAALLAGRALVAAEGVADSLQQLLPLLQQQHKGNRAAAADLFSSTVEEVADQLQELARQNSQSPAAAAAEEALARLEAGGDLTSAGSSDVQIVRGLQQEAVGLAVLDLRGLILSRGEQLLELVQAKELSRKMAYDQVRLALTSKSDEVITVISCLDVRFLADDAGVLQWAPWVRATVCHQCVTSVSPVCHQCVTSVSPVCHQCVTSVSPVCHQCVTSGPLVVSCSLQPAVELSVEQHQTPAIVDCCCG